MYKRSAGLLMLALCLVSSAMAQEGHPLVGTWQGDWGQNQDNRNFLTVIMQWDGKNISGLINPGPNSSDLPSGAVKLDSSNWTVHMEIDVADDSGVKHHMTADGKLDNIGSHARTLSGTWRDANGRGDFTLTRQ